MTIEVCSLVSKLGEFKGEIRDRIGSHHVRNKTDDIRSQQVEF